LFTNSYTETMVLLLRYIRYWNRLNYFVVWLKIMIMYWDNS